MSVNASALPIVRSIVGAAYSGIVVCVMLDGAGAGAEGEHIVLPQKVMVIAWAVCLYPMRDKSFDTRKSVAVVMFNLLTPRLFKSS